MFKQYGGEVDGRSFALFSFNNILWLFNKQKVERAEILRWVCWRGLEVPSHSITIVRNHLGKPVVKRKFILPRYV